MIVRKRKLQAGLKVEDFYKYVFGDEVFMKRVREAVMHILISYGKIATESKYSLSNVDKLDANIKIISGDRLEVKIRWGSNKQEKAEFRKKIHDMRYGSNDYSIQSLEDYVRGKRKFFNEHGGLASGAYPYRAGIMTDNQYAKALFEKLEESGNLGGAYVYKGQRADASYNNPIAPVYSKRQIDFYAKIEQKVNKMLIQRYKQISLRMFDQYNSRMAGASEYYCIYSSTGVGYIEASKLTAKQRKFLDAVLNTEITFETSDEMILSVTSYARARAVKVIADSKKYQKDVISDFKDIMKSKSILGKIVGVARNRVVNNINKMANELLKTK